MAARSAAPDLLDRWPDNDAYSAEFDRAEVVLGVLAQDGCQRADRGCHRRARLGSIPLVRSVDLAGHAPSRNPIDDLQHELATEAALWGPLRVEPFGGDVDRAQEALDKYSETFAEISRQRFRGPLLSSPR